MMYLSITFDYELFFGKNFCSYDEILFQPTYELIEALRSKGVSATFFTDVCSIPVSQQYNQKNYIDGFTKQIQYMAQQSQDVQLHIHPHWFHSRWENGEWNFSNKGYRLHEFQDDGRVNIIISDGIKYLIDNIRPVNPQYECIAYRAGGFSLQPHKQIVRALYENGIRVDSSIAPQLSVKSEAISYDYRHTLQKLNWYISEESEWWQDNPKEKSLLEIPIATIDKEPISFAFKRVFKPAQIKLGLGTKRGTYISTQTERNSKLKTYYQFLTGFNAISMDAYAADYLYRQVRRLDKSTKCDEQVVAIIGHPKLVNSTYIDNLCKFIDMIMNDKRYEFISIYDAYRMKETTR